MEQKIDPVKNTHRFQMWTTESVCRMLAPPKFDEKGDPIEERRPIEYDIISDEKLEAMNKAYDNIMAVLKSITEKHPKSTEFIEDTIACPICKDGTVHYCISGHINGHIHARCSNGCVNFGE